MLQSKAYSNLCLFNFITPWVCLQFTGGCSMMQLPLAAGQQGRQAFKLLSGSSRLHEVLSIEGLWQEKRTHPIKRSGYLFFLECKRHSQQLRSFNWHPNWIKLASNLCRENLSPAKGHLKSCCWVLVAHAAGENVPCFLQGIHEPLIEIEDFLKLFVAYILMKGNATRLCALQGKPMP